MASALKITSIVSVRYFPQVTRDKARLHHKSKPILALPIHHEPPKTPFLVIKRPLISLSWNDLMLYSRSIIPVLVRRVTQSACAPGNLEQQRITAGSDKITLRAVAPEKASNRKVSESLVKFGGPKTIQSGSASCENRILVSWTSAIAFIAHTKVPWKFPVEPTHRNHWTIFICTGNNTGVSLNYDDELRITELDWLPKLSSDGNCERVVWLPVSKANLGEALRSPTAISSVPAVQELVNLAEECMPSTLSKEFDSRSFILRFLNSLVERNLIDGLVGIIKVESLRKDVGKLWPEGSPLPLEDELPALTGNAEQCVKETLLRRSRRLLLMNHSGMMRGRRASLP